MKRIRLNGFYERDCDVFALHMLYFLFSILQCMTEGLDVAFQTRPQFSANWGQKNEVYAEVRNYSSFWSMTAC